MHQPRPDPDAGPGGPDVAALLRRACPGEDVELVETHTSVLAFHGGLVDKAKKPVRFPFLDLSTSARRAEVIRRELELNRRLAPDVYLGLVPLRDETGRVVEQALRMRRMPEERRLTRLLVNGAVPCLDALARLVARFHADSRRSPVIDAAARPEAVAELWELSFAQTHPFVGAVLDEADAIRVETLARRYLAGRAMLFERRVAQGCARDGHGDLLAEDVFCLPDGPRVLDCLEFDDRLRFGDVLADVAFLAMDLERHGRLDLADRFLDGYRLSSGDEWPASLADHWVAYRAHVRAKVACLRHDQGDAGAAGRARRDLDLCRDRLERARVRLVLVGGPPGTGKSTLAAGLARETGWTLLRSDVERKRAAGMAPHDRGGADLDAGLYRPEVGDAVYDSLLAQAGALLADGTSVVLDASWADRERRGVARRSANDATADVVELRTDVAASEAERRVRARLELGTDASDATPEVARAVAARFAPWPEATVVSTDGPRERALTEALGVTGPGSRSARAPRSDAAPSR